MKKIIFILLASISLNAQDKFSFQVTTDNVIFQKGILYAGVEFLAEFSNGVYIRPQIHYASLKDGYLETSAGIGYHLDYNRFGYKAGIKLGVINRADTYPIFAYEASIEYNITNSFSFGLRASYDRRGDSAFYDGDSWKYNSQGFLKFKL